MTEPPRRFPAPWRADKMPGGYVVRDARRAQGDWVMTEQREPCLNNTTGT
jgi:hypothetical protein